MTTGGGSPCPWDGNARGCAGYSRPVVWTGDLGWTPARKEKHASKQEMYALLEGTWLPTTLFNYELLTSLGWILLGGVPRLPIPLPTFLFLFPRYLIRQKALWMRDGAATMSSLSLFPFSITTHPSVMKPEESYAVDGVKHRDALACAMCCLSGPRIPRGRRSCADGRA